MAARLLMWMAVVCAAVGARAVLGQTNPQDVVMLRSLTSEWQNTPPDWLKSDDPCGKKPWTGVGCADSRVISLQLSSMDLKGTLSSDIGQLTGLQTLHSSNSYYSYSKRMDLSFNINLGGPLTHNIGKLKKLHTLILAGCSFNGSIPEELGSLPLLSYLALNTNNFIGNIPVSVGNLSNLFWFDISENKLTGTLPVSSGNTSGLDQLYNCKHFHFNKNQLSGSIPREIFNSKMTLIHVLFDGNQLTGKIPETVGLVSTLETLRLDRNELEGPIPQSISNLTSIIEIHLASNQLTGKIPNLTGLNNLNYLDLSNNSFTSSSFPEWLTTLRALTTLNLQYSNLEGPLSGKIFSLPQLEQVLLANNTLNGTLDLTGTVGQQLQLVNLQNNRISNLAPGAPSSVTVILKGNPICNSAASANYCQPKLKAAYSTRLANCDSVTCSNEQDIVPFSCKCAYPYQGLMTFRAPAFSDLTNRARFQRLESSFWTQLGLSANSVTLQKLEFTSSNYLQLQLSLFPSSGMYFDRAEIQKLGFYLSNQTYKPPVEFGTYIFIAFRYPFSDGVGGKSSLSATAIVGIVVACIVLLIGLVVVGLYATKQKRRAKKALRIANPFASWEPNTRDAGSAPQLKGLRPFSFEDIKNLTNSFSQANEIGMGAYGKVYKATLSNGQVIAIKRAQRGSNQGAVEFKTEIELLSRVHHKNLVNLVGFCYDKGEQMLVYEYISNGTLRDNLIRKTGIMLDWNRRLKIALGSARGLAYLHELADPPIIHRDIKSVNILLDDTLTAKVADFGISKLVSDSEMEHVTTQVKGTRGYLDPEYLTSQVLTEKSDVYSFGVVMLELITSRMPIEMGKYMMNEIRTALDWNDMQHCGLTAVMDPYLVNMEVQLTGFSKFLSLALQCVEKTRQRRPRMNEVVKEIEAILGEGDDTTDGATFGEAPSHLDDLSLLSGSKSSHQNGM